MTIDELIGKKVKIYYNLHKHCLSVQYKGLVVAHLQEIALSDVKFKVNEAGRQRVLREKSKNVHAFLVGTVGKFKLFRGLEGFPVSYNPYKYSSFVHRENETPVYQAGMVHVVGKDILALQ